MRIELEHRRRENIKVSQGTLQEMLNQPYIAPALEYEVHAVQPKETAYVQKAASLKGQFSHHQVKGFVKDALQAQNDRFHDAMQSKDVTIFRQKKVMLAQREELMKLQKMANDFATKSNQNDTIKLEGIE